MYMFHLSFTFIQNGVLDYLNSNYVLMQMLRWIQKDKRGKGGWRILTKMANGFDITHGFWNGFTSSSSLLETVVLL